MRLWKETINLESSPVDADIILSRTVEVILQSVELWLALMHLKTPEQAKAMLNKAHKVVSKSHEIWITAHLLLEQEVEAADKNPTHCTYI